MMRKNYDDGWAAAFAEFINHGSMLGQHNHILTVKDDFAAVDRGVFVSLSYINLENDGPWRFLEGFKGCHYVARGAKRPQKILS